MEHLQTIKTIVLAIFASGGFWTLLQYLIQRRDTKNDAIAKDMVALMRISLLQSYKDYIKAGQMTIAEREAVDELYDRYIARGGNGTIKSLHEELNGLPTAIEVWRGSNGLQ